MTYFMDDSLWNVISLQNVAGLRFWTQASGWIAQTRTLWSKGASVPNGTTYMICRVEIIGPLNDLRGLWWKHWQRRQHFAGFLTWQNVECSILGTNWTLHVIVGTIWWWSVFLFFSSSSSDQGILRTLIFLGESIWFKFPKNFNVTTTYADGRLEMRQYEMTSIERCFSRLISAGISAIGLFLIFNTVRFLKLQTS